MGEHKVIYIFFRLLLSETYPSHGKRQALLFKYIKGHFMGVCIHWQTHTSCKVFILKIFSSYRVNCRREKGCMTHTWAFFYHINFNKNCHPWCTETFSPHIECSHWTLHFHIFLFSFFYLLIGIFASILSNFCMHIFIFLLV